MNNLLSKSWVRLISILLIQSFLMLDIAWAGGTELNLTNNTDTLSAPIEISQPQVMDSFLKLHSMNAVSFSETVSENVDINSKKEKSKWSFSKIWRSFKKTRFAKGSDSTLKLIAQAYSEEDNGFKSILMPALLTPALIALSSKLVLGADLSLPERAKLLVSNIKFEQINDIVVGFYSSIPIQGQVVLFYLILPAMLGLVIVGVSDLFKKINNRNVIKPNRLKFPLTQKTIKNDLPSTRGYDLAVESLQATGDVKALELFRSLNNQGNGYFKARFKSLLIPALLTPALIALFYGIPQASDGSSADTSIIGWVLGGLAVVVGAGAIKFKENIKVYVNDNIVGPIQFKRYAMTKQYDKLTTEELVKLLGMLKSHSKFTDRNQIIRQISSRGDAEKSRVALLEILLNNRNVSRSTAAWALGIMEEGKGDQANEPTVNALIRVLNEGDYDKYVTEKAYESLVQIGNEKGLFYAYICSQQIESAAALARASSYAYELKYNREFPLLQAEAEQVIAIINKVDNNSLNVFKNGKSKLKEFFNRRFDFLSTKNLFSITGALILVHVLSSFSWAGNESVVTAEWVLSSYLEGVVALGGVVVLMIL